MNLYDIFSRFGPILARAAQMDRQYSAILAALMSECGCDKIDRSLHDVHCITVSFFLIHREQESRLSQLDHASVVASRRTHGINM